MFDQHAFLDRRRVDPLHFETRSRSSRSLEAGRNLCMPGILGVEAPDHTHTHGLGLLSWRRAAPCAVSVAYLGVGPDSPAVTTGCSLNAQHSPHPPRRVSSERMRIERVDARTRGCNSGPWQAARTRFGSLSAS